MWTVGLDERCLTSIRGGAEQWRSVEISWIAMALTEWTLVRLFCQLFPSSKINVASEIKQADLSEIKQAD